MGDEKSMMSAAAEADDGATRVNVAVTPDMAGWRMDRALAVLVPTLSRERLKALMSAGAVTGGAGLMRDPARKAVAGDRLTVTIPQPAPSHAVAQDLNLVVVYEDAHLLIVDKPAGLVVHPAAGNLDGTLVNALLHHCAGRLSGIGGVARPGIVHRIDKDTSGLLVVAKDDPTHEGLSRQFAAHTVERLYTAVVFGQPAPPAGRIEGSLARSSANRQKMAIVPAGRGKHAVTHYRMVQPLRDASVVECRLETGRTHQVRVHMASIGHPLLGDPAYGRTRSTHRADLAELGFARQALHAATLGFVHPITKEKLSFASPLPADIQDLIGRLSI
jgi:23S rRNA pseudouridine1911/1915/1917 synthase